MEHSYREKLWILDIFFILTILFNVGALVITNILVIKNAPESKFVEDNKAASERFGFEYGNEVRFSGYILHCLCWAILIFIYVLRRANVHNALTYWWLTFWIIFMVTFTAFDFFNNFGYWLGKVFYG